MDLCDSANVIEKLNQEFIELQNNLKKQYARWEQLETEQSE